MKKINWNKSYTLIMMDIDDVLNEKVLQRYCNEWNAYAKVYKTTNGFHVVFIGDITRPMTTSDALIMMLSMRVDRLYIRRWLLTGEFTLFNVRRDKVNRRILKWFEPCKVLIK
jgi:hypothetical protein